jgi:molybdenum cofactor cytidylyltransferase
MGQIGDTNDMAEKLQLADIACVLLAAGRSERFGEACKLSSLFRGRRLGDHAVALLARMPFGTHVIVQRPGGFSATDPRFTQGLVTDANAGLAHSIACGMMALGGQEAKAVLIALADMPLVSAAHIDALIDAFDVKDAKYIIASAYGTKRMPPVLFGRGHFQTLSYLSGDEGARHLIASAPTVAGDLRMLSDVDTPEALKELAR